MLRALLRAPGKRTPVGKRDHALLRLLGDCGWRNAELRSLTARAIRRPCANRSHHHVFVRGQGPTSSRWTHPDPRRLKGAGAR